MNVENVVMPKSMTLSGVEMKEVQRIIEMLGAENVVRFAVMPTFNVGRPFVPPCGYVLNGRKATPFRRELVDQATIFKGRAALPIFHIADQNTRAVYAELVKGSKPLSTLLEEKIIPEWFVNTTHAVIEKAMQLVNNSVDQKLTLSIGNNKVASMLMRLEPSEVVQSSISLVEAVTDQSDIFIVTELHALPEKHELSALVDRMSGKSTMLEFFSSEFMRRYNLTLRVLRALTCKLMGRAIVEVLVDGDISERMPIYQNPDSVEAAAQMDAPNSGFINWVTNMLVPDVRGEAFLFFSEALEGDLGAIIDNGPFCESIWVNKGGVNATEQILQAGLSGGIPYEMPPTIDRSAALEIIVAEQVAIQERRMERNGRSTMSKEEKDEEDNQNDGVVMSENSKFLIATRQEHQPTIFSSTHPFIVGPSINNALVGFQAAEHAKNSVNMVVWRESSMHLPVVIPDQLVNYRRPLNTKGVIDLLADHGIKIELATINTHRLMRVSLRAIGPINDRDQLMMYRAAGEIHQNRRATTAIHGSKVSHSK